MEGFFPLASGSKGNCTYLGTDSCKILIDLGISKQLVTHELLSMNIYPEDIQAIFISHEHSDHISGIKSFVKTYNTTIICNLETARSLCQILDVHPTFKIFSTGTTFSFYDLKIQTFNVPHDAIDPVGFIFHYRDEKLGFCTDLGWITSWIVHELYDCDYLLIEANHDPELVRQSTRPDIYKKRVLSKLGHISNRECGELLQKILTPKIKKIYLGHLSRECNTPELALSNVSSAIENITSILPVIAESQGISDPIYFKPLVNV
ncbi:ribonuclease Z,Predicted metal-dependent RNase, consists of a metallo-beta-lactamase domain and an RNA-binding KH domain,ribonuclease Z,Metallo-beta-lactamase superfamily [Chlamydia poikilotherma]|uniref:Ribonuclease Z,Predicted metal-dependent RNase, consists of a metallo-beta-lactamase domain and an RNA-binding KH domain,ribonuclease Z,Metallo-beta-lactamase superfamily n=1 Tax=Chlamydia poikilotherma TaxID=1967783 RepID=A0A3B0Q8Y9_9CHLA|nr:MBL fold metallo-hydrolase [Chlamydia poikilotherma]SYX09347.1 ribonuclease Z,Predicted metal-dependent RNase, consists of a metallo-beta-lactamase domain and an RNA-binding KH domain,ribonuclease Z,Metallo-beta-lactamase superfamily [Chlamydia poikilotherma]